MAFTTVTLNYRDLQQGRKPVCLSCSRLDYTCVYQTRSSAKSHRQNLYSAMNSERSSPHALSPDMAFPTPAVTQASPPTSVSTADSVYDVDITDADNLLSTPENLYQHEKRSDELVSSLSPFENYFFTNFPFEQSHDQLGADATMQLDLQPWLLPTSEINLDWRSTLSEAPTFPSTGSSTPLTVSSDAQKSPGEAFSLPLREEINHLCDIFFSRFHPILPILHRRSFLETIPERDTPLEEDVVLLSLLALSSSGHSDASIRGKGEEWLKASKRIIDKAIKNSTVTLQHVQAGVWITFHLFLRAEMSECWIFLGKTWRMACPLGLNRIDAKKRGCNIIPGNLDNARAIEEMRRTIWALFLLDRSLSFVCGWPFAIDDRQFMVNTPVEENIFQGSDTESLLKTTTSPFPTSLDKAIEPIGDCYGYICYATVLLGRIVDYNNSPDADEVSEDRRRVFEKLEIALARLLLAIPSQFTKITYLQSTLEQENTCWLICLVQTCSILLHHPTVRAVTRQEDSPSEEDNPSPEFLRCLAGTKHIVSAIKDLVTVAGRGFLNPLAGPILFLSGRILIIHWLETNDICTRSEIDLILLSLDKMKEQSEPLASKYKHLLLYDLSRSSASVKEIKTNDGSYMTPQCRNPQSD
ncbi:hypothetical protein TWF696_000221 [Orbilia brochopaga]|uniref:Xylanolytic transcriptional activator regulatory domain-containing protein n=1 Tax=Orbilia brochopaga TaxID=3140254 RepID=A0AAV9VD42_9PEZI